MQLSEIKNSLNGNDSQQKLKAITALKDYDSAIAVPLLLGQMKAPEFIIRSFVAMILGKKRTAESFTALVQLLELDQDPNVRAEASSALALFGEPSLEYLVKAFGRDHHWLVQRSILAVVMDMDQLDALYQICLLGLQAQDQTVQAAAVEALGLFPASTYQELTLTKLLELTSNSLWLVRVSTVKALKKYADPRAKEALHQMSQDQDYRVVAAVLEGLLV